MNHMLPMFSATRWVCSGCWRISSVPSEPWSCRPSISVIRRSTTWSRIVQAESGFRCPANAEPDGCHDRAFSAAAGCGAEPPNPPYRRTWPARTGNHGRAHVGRVNVWPWHAFRRDGQARHLPSSASANPSEVLTQVHHVEDLLANVPGPRKAVASPVTLRDSGRSSTPSSCAGANTIGPGTCGCCAN